MVAYHKNHNDQSLVHVVCIMKGVQGTGLHVVLHGIIVHVKGGEEDAWYSYSYNKL